MSGELERILIAQSTPSRSRTLKAIRPLLTLYERLKPARSAAIVLFGGVAQGTYYPTTVNNAFGRSAYWMADGAPAAPLYVAVGTGASGTILRTDVRLATEIKRKAITSATPSGGEVTYVADFTVGEAQGTLTELGLFDIAGDDGTATGGGNDYLDDAGKAWGADAWVGYRLYLIGGTGAGQSKTITTNTATRLTVGTAWAVNPDATTVYCIGGAKAGTSYMFARGAISPGLVKGAVTMQIQWLFNLRG